MFLTFGLHSLSLIPGYPFTNCCRGSRLNRGHPWSMEVLSPLSGNQVRFQQSVKLLNHVCLPSWILRHFVPKFIWKLNMSKCNFSTMVAQSVQQYKSTKKFTYNEIEQCPIWIWKLYYMFFYFLFLFFKYVFFFFFCDQEFTSTNTAKYCFSKNVNLIENLKRKLTIPMYFPSNIV